MTTFSAKPAEVVHEWFVIDATDKVLGRVASEVALRLRGKHKAIYTPHVDTGDFIVIINASKLKVTGTKSLDKVYYRHSGYPGGITATNFRDMQAKHPGRARARRRSMARTGRRWRAHCSMNPGSMPPRRPVRSTRRACAPG